MSDATANLIARFKDREDWDKVIDKVPIFVEHECYGVPSGNDDDGNPITRKVIRLPGDARPEGGKLLYAIDARALNTCADAINKNLTDFAKPIKLFLGHTKDPGKHPQADQPPLVGYGVGATVGPWGPKGKLAVLTTQFVEKGQGEEVRKYPERSPEFYPGKHEITALALLKSDPRLPMGMVTYSDERVCYGQGFDDDAKPAADAKPADDAKPEDKAPTDEPEPEDDDNGELSPEEAKQAMRYAAHYERHHPVWKDACVKYAAACAGPTNGTTNDNDQGDKEPEKMSRTDEAERLAALEESVGSLKKENARLKATAGVNKVRAEGVLVKDPSAEINYMADLDDAGQAAYLEKMRVNYARDDKPPVGDDSFRVYGGPVETDPAEPTFGEEDVDAAVAYCETNHLDPERDWDKAMKAILAEKKKPAAAR